MYNSLQSIRLGAVIPHRYVKSWTTVPFPSMLKIGSNLRQTKKDYKHVIIWLDTCHTLLSDPKLDRARAMVTRLLIYLLKYY